MSWHSFCLNKNLITELTLQKQTHAPWRHRLLVTAWLSPRSLNLYSGRPCFVSSPIQHGCLWPPALIMTETWQSNDSSSKCISCLFFVWKKVCLDLAFGFEMSLLYRGGYRHWHWAGWEVGAVYVETIEKALPRRPRWNYWNVLTLDLGSEAWDKKPYSVRSASSKH